MFGLRALGALPYTGRPETAVSGAIKCYLNNASSASAGINIPSVVIGATVGDYIEIKAVANTGNPSNNYRVAGQQSGFNNFIEIRPASAFLGAGGSGIQFTTGYTQPAVGSIFTIRFTRASSTTWRCALNGSVLGSDLSNSGNLTLDAFFRFSSSTTEAFRGGIYYVAISTNGGASATRYYDPSSSNDSSTTLIDTVGGQHGTYVGDWVTGTRYMPYLDTTISNALVPQAVSGAIKWYLKWPATTGNNNKALVQLSGIGTASYLTLVFAENVIDPNTSGTGAYLYDGRRQLDTVNSASGGYFLEYQNGVQTSGVSEFYLNGVTSNNAAWRTAKAGDAYKFFFDAGVDGVISVGGRYNEVEGFPLLALRTIIVDDANGSHVIDLTNKVGLTQFTSNDGVITAKLFGFNIGACWVPYLDTTVSTPIVNQGVNGIANYFCTLNGTSYFTAPSLGNLLTGSPKIRINIKKFKQFGSSVEPIFWQGGNSWGTRELALRNNSSLGNIIIGGVATGFTWSDLTNAFGDPNLTCNEFGFEINGTNAIFYKNKIAVFTVPNLSKGTSRLEGALLFFGAQPSNDTAGSTSAISIVPNGMQYGDIEIFINDVLVRNYKMPDNGSLVTDTVNAGTNFLKFAAGTNTYVYCDLKVPTQNAGRALQVEYEDEFEARRTSTEFPVVSTHVSSATDLIFLKSGSDVEIRSSNNPNWVVTTGVDLTQFHVFKYRTTFNGTNRIRELYIDGVFIASTTLTQSAMGVMNAFASLSSGTSRAGDLKYYKRTDFVTPANNRLYDARIGNGVDPVLYEAVQNTTISLSTANYSWEKQTVAVQRGTFTIDNNEWRQYIENVVSAVTAKVIKWFNGTAWVSKPIKWFNGTAWVQKTFKR